MERSALWLLCIILATDVSRSSIPSCEARNGSIIQGFAEVVAYGYIAVSLPLVPSGSSSCSVTAKVWAGIAVDESFKVFLPNCLGTAFFGASSYGDMFTSESSFQFEVLGLDASNNTICHTNNITLRSAVTDCSGSLEFDRPDAISVSVSIPFSQPVFGRCQLSLSQYNDFVFSNSIFETGPCSSTFVMTSDRMNLTFANGASTSFTWSYLYDGVAPLCTSQVISYNDLGGPSCFQNLEIVSDSFQSFFVAIKPPRPIDGLCFLNVISCAGQSVNESLQFPSCGDAVEINFEVIQSVYSSIKAGQTCILSWGYFYGTQSCASSNHLITPPLRTLCLLEDSGSTGGQIRLSGSMNASLAPDLGACEISLLSCGDNGIVPPITKPLDNCSNFSSAVVFNSSDTPLIQAGVNCIFQLFHSEEACLSYPESFIAASEPSWTTGVQNYWVNLIKTNCLQLRWKTVDQDGGSPVLCYKVWRSDGGDPFYLILDCGGSLPGSLSVVTCGVFAGKSIRLKVDAVNAVGFSSLTTEQIRIEFLTNTPFASLLSPSSQGPYSSASFPVVLVQAPDNATTDRIFVAQLWNTNSGGNVFAETLAGLGEGLYRLIFSDFVPQGNYSLRISSLEQSGLQGQYWPNAVFEGTPIIERKDPQVNFDWTQGPVFTYKGKTIFDLISVRWTGFILPAFFEVYTFTLETANYVRLYVDDELLIDSLRSRCPVASCSGSIELSGGSYSSIRIDYVVSKGVEQTVAPGVELFWESFSQRREIIPTEFLFRSVYTNNGFFQPIMIVPDIPSTPNALVYVAPTVVAGSPGIVYIQSRDKFNQNVSSSDSEVYSVTFTPEEITITAVPSGIDGLYIAPFSLTVAATYTLLVVDTLGITAPSSELVVRVIPAEAFSVLSSSVIVPPALTAGIPFPVSMVLLDVFGNNVSTGDVFWSAIWLFDETSIQRLGSNNDDLRRVQKFGSTFEGNTSAYDPVSGLFTVDIELLITGTFTAELTVSGSPEGSLASPLQFKILPQRRVEASQSVLLTNPASLTFVAGRVSTVSVQLRDIFGNCIQTFPEGLNLGTPIRAVLQHYPNVVEETACTPNQDVSGIFDCEITPYKSGNGTLFTVRVNGLDVWYIPDQSGGEVEAVSGPWLVYVGPAAIDASASLLTGLVASYRVGSFSTQSDLTLTLKDRFGNIIQIESGYKPEIIVKFLRSDSSVACVLDSSEFAFNAVVINLPLSSCTVASPTDPSDPEFAGWFLFVSVNGAPVPVPGWPVRFYPGPVTFANSTCGSYQTNQTAGIPFSVTCSLRDAFGNTITSSLLLLQIQFSGGHTYSFPLALSGNNYITNANLLIAGAYTAKPILAQPGGLIAQYFGDPSFHQLLYPGTVPETDTVYTFTNIAPLLEIEFQGGAVVGNVVARSVIWTGLLLPPSPQTVRFHLRAIGGVQITLGDALVANYPAASGVDSTFDFEFFSPDPVNIQIRYVSGGDALFYLKWAYPGLTGIPFSIPSSSLLAPLVVPSLVPGPVLVFPGVISPLSFAILPTSPVIARLPDFFIIQARDAHGNDLDSASACLSGTGITPDCLFDISFTVQDGSPSPSLADLENGQYRVDFSFATAASPRTMNIRLIYGPAPSDRTPLSGSPYSIPVTG